MAGNEMDTQYYVLLDGDVSCLRIEAKTDTSDTQVSNFILKYENHSHGRVINVHYKVRDCGIMSFVLMIDNLGRERICHG